MMKEPVRARKAVLLPSGMAPRPVATMANGMLILKIATAGTNSVNLQTNSVAGMGQLSRSFTLLKMGDRGTALSRARAQ